MENQKLSELLVKLHAELEQTRSVDDSARKLLQSVMNDIEQLIDHPAEDLSPQRHKLIERLTETLQHFEESHPVLTLTIGSIMDTLSKMGI